MAIFALLSDQRVPDSGALLDGGLVDRDVGVRAAAMGAVAKNWPTQASHLTILRNEIDSPVEQVAQAAMGAIANIGDDRETGKILTRMEAGGPIAAQARATLTRLYGSDMGADVHAWRTAFDEREQRLAPLIQHAQEVFHGSDNEAIRAVLHQLLMLRNPPRSDVADAIAPLLANSDPDIARMAREGLGNIGGGIAMLSLKAGGPAFGDNFYASKARVSAPAPVVKNAPSAFIDRSTIYVFGFIFCFIAGVIWLLFRSPLKDTKPMKAATRAIKRRIQQGTRIFKKI